MDMRELELMLLEMWAANDIKEVYKYKDRIKAFREPLTNIELFTDLGSQLFKDVEDIASHRPSTAEDFKVSVQTLIENRKSVKEGKE